jgi:hypothetical protein
MTLGGGPMKMTVDRADDWCNHNSSCHGFTFQTNATGETDIYFRDETQIFFMDSQLSSLTGPLGQSQWTSHVSKARAPPLSKPHCGNAVDGGVGGGSPGSSVCTSGIQIWVKDLSSPGNEYQRHDEDREIQQEENGAALALLLVNHDETTLSEYSLEISQLPNYFKHGGKPLEVRDVWRQETLPYSVGGDGQEAGVGAKSTPLTFKNVASHDSVFYVLMPTTATTATMTTTQTF